jgi:diguanylate cyclase (GGDEF)-like protein
LEDDYGFPDYEDLLKVDFRDPLTNLFNRNIYEYKINRLTGNNFIGLIDIDNFKKINDIYTHQVGNRIIRNVGSILRKLNNKHITFFRVGGDEFVFCTEDLTYEKTIAYCEKVISKVNCIKLDGFKVNCSIGLVKYEGIKNQKIYDYRILADLAMYKSKEDGGNRITFYSTDDISGLAKDEKVAKLIKELKR